MIRSWLTPLPPHASPRWISVLVFHFIFKLAHKVFTCVCMRNRGNALVCPGRTLTSHLQKCAALSKFITLNLTICDLFTHPLSHWYTAKFMNPVLWCNWRRNVTPCSPDPLVNAPSGPLFCFVGQNYFFCHFRFHPCWTGKAKRILGAMTKWLVSICVLY